MKNVFSSKSLPSHLDERQRFMLWQDIHFAEIWSVEYQTSEVQPFEAEIEATVLGPIVLGQMAGTIRRANRQARNIVEDGRDGYLLLVNKGDTVLAGRQVGRDYRVGQGEAALVSASEPLTMVGGDKNLWMNVVIPRAVLADAFPGVDDKLALTVGTKSEALSLLQNYCRMIETNEELVSPRLITHATETIVDLVGLAIGAKGDPAELAGMRGLRSARFQAIMGEIERNFASSRISAQTVARRLGLSTRYVHVLLHEHGISFANHVLELRLSNVFKMLLARQSGVLQISVIAMMNGFSDVSYFNRCFRRRFGCAPSDVR